MSEILNAVFQFVAECEKNSILQVNVEIFKDIGSLTEQIIVKRHYHQDENCYLTHKFRVVDDQIMMYDSGDQFMQSWDLNDPNCFNELRERILDLHALCEILAIYRSWAKNLTL